MTKNKFIATVFISIPICALLFMIFIHAGWPGLMLMLACGIGIGCLRLAFFFWNRK